MMTVVSTKEFNANQEKYFDIPQDEQVILEPDDDLRYAITKDEFKKRAHDIIHKIFANK